MKTIAAVSRILQIVNSTNYTISSIGSFTQEPVPSPSSYATYTPVQTFNMSNYYSPSVSSSSSISPMPTPSFVSLSATLTATPSISVSSSPKIVAQSVSPFYALTTEQWSYILVPCIFFAVITWWCNIKLWSRVDELDHQLKKYQSQQIQNNPMNHHSVRNIIPGLTTGNKAAFSHV